MNTNNLETLVEEDYELLSVNAVSKRLKINYTTAKNMIIQGCIESINIAGKLKVPIYKLRKFITQQNLTSNKISVQVQGASDYKERIQSIFQKPGGQS